jgi:hypothetical protein
MKLAIPCTSCGRAKPAYKVEFYQESCEGVEDVSRFADDSGSCSYYLHPGEAYADIRRVKEKRTAAIKAAKAPLRQNPFEALRKLKV